MEMNDSEKKQVKEWLHDHWAGPGQCPVCQQGKWVLNPIISELRTFQKGGLAVGGTVFPIINITCGNCGYIVQFSAMQLGIVKVPPQVKGPPPKAVESDIAPPIEKEASDE